MSEFENYGPEWENALIDFATEYFYGRKKTSNNISILFFPLVFVELLISWHRSSIILKN